MKTVVIFMAIGLGGIGLVCVGVPLGLSWIIGGGDKPRVLTSSHFISPDQRWEATVEHIDNGMGFGMGALYYEVHVHKPNVREFSHGNDDRTSVYYIKDEGIGSEAPRVYWEASTNSLIIEKSCDLAPGRALDHLDKVKVLYKTRR